MTAPLEARREARWNYSGETVEAIEEWNCSKGCKHSGTKKEREEFGPGGNCTLLAIVSLGDGTPIPELLDDGDTVTCTKREPWPGGGQSGPRPKTAPAGVDPLFGEAS